MMMTAPVSPLDDDDSDTDDDAVNAEQQQQHQKQNVAPFLIAISILTTANNSTHLSFVLGIEL
jgi:hypothetical protein